VRTSSREGEGKAWQGVGARVVCKRKAGRACSPWRSLSLYRPRMKHTRNTIRALPALPHMSAPASLAPPLPAPRAPTLNPLAAHPWLRSQSTRAWPVGRSLPHTRGCAAPIHERGRRRTDEISWMISWAQPTTGRGLLWQPDWRHVHGDSGCLLQHRQVRLFEPEHSVKWPGLLLATTPLPGCGLSTAAGRRA